MKLDAEVKREIGKMALLCAACAVLLALVFVFTGHFDYTVITGSVLGYLLAVGNYYFMSVGITYALASGDEVIAKRKMHTSYIIRSVAIIAVAAAAIVLRDYINPIPVLAAILYPNVIIVIRNYIKIRFRKNGDDSDVPQTDTADAENTDFETDDAGITGEDMTDPAQVALPLDIASTETDSEDEDEPDEFERVISKFAKGPIPGADDKTKDK